MEPGGSNGGSGAGSPQPPPNAVAYRVKVVGQPGTLTCRLDPGAPVSALRIAVARHIHVEPSERVRLVVGGRTMKDALRVQDYNIDPASTVIRAVVSRQGAPLSGRKDVAVAAFYPLSPCTGRGPLHGPRVGSLRIAASAPARVRVAARAAVPRPARGATQHYGGPSGRRGRRCCARPVASDPCSAQQSAARPGPAAAGPHSPADGCCPH